MANGVSRIVRSIAALNGNNEAALAKNQINGNNVAKALKKFPMRDIKRDKNKPSSQYDK